MTPTQSPTALPNSLMQPDSQPRHPVWLNGQRIGSVATQVLTWVNAQTLPTRPSFALAMRGTDWHISGDGTHALAWLAHAFHAADVFSVRRQWRNELLAVFNADWQQVATAERGVMRVLGLATWAVHLHGRTADARVWMQQRALTKATDPGRWDTLMGGMISAADTLSTALARETWEEAGLHLHQLQGLRVGGHFWVRRPNPVDGGVGHVEERIDWFDCLVPDGVTPVNQDGEVSQFVLMDTAELNRLQDAGQVTTEAGLILQSYTIK